MLPPPQASGVNLRATDTGATSRWRSALPRLRRSRRGRVLPESAGAALRDKSLAIFRATFAQSLRTPASRLSGEGRDRHRRIPPVHLRLYWSALPDFSLLSAP